MNKPFPPIRRRPSGVNQKAAESQRAPSLRAGRAARSSLVGRRNSYDRDDNTPTQAASSRHGLSPRSSDRGASSSEDQIRQWEFARDVNRAKGNTPSDSHDESDSPPSAGGGASSEPLALTVIGGACLMVFLFAVGVAIYAYGMAS